MSENKKHQGNYEGTASMKAENQDMEFVNDTVEGVKTTKNLNGAIRTNPPKVT
ncbi:hypothetical protein N0M98_05215 [Paenibacillus doosanensis]|uniref:Uncharacterized protein n=1 Tax=Paenibacillus konkukensis TaxID=2020716 RepID=A0ABY4RTF2_9BACL|nr:MULTISPECIES: hypothetical protein [Paenibacillus]MCS7459533.1 hypothetical protein [Paenibacillus doosanensis]UQZ84808.1 hypothetical protein SK3146_04063 [Paenibacillus konkukensis]